MEEQHVFLCTGSTCTGQGAEEVLYDLRQGLQARHINHVRVTLARCLGQCGGGPNMVIYGKGNPPEGVWYGHLERAAVDRLIAQHLVKGNVLSHLVITPVNAV